jgi:hypothetical protein
VRGVLGGLAILVVALAAVAGVIVVLQSRDDAEVGGAGGPGRRVEDRCPAETARIARDRRPLSEAQVQTALAQGNVVILYSGRPPAELRRLQRDVAGPYDAEIAAAGQAVVLAERDAAAGVEARAWGRRLVADTPGDPRLREFAEAWLGQGEPEPSE